MSVGKVPTGKAYGAIGIYYKPAQMQVVPR